jgi:chromosome segregation ATPase
MGEQSQLNIRTADTIIKTFREFCATGKMTQSEGFASALKLAILQQSDVEDETLAIRKSIYSESQHLTEMLDKLQDTHSSHVNELERKLKELASELEKEKACRASLEKQLTQAKPVAEKPDPSAKLAEQLARSENRAKTLENACELSKKAASDFEAKVAELEAELGLRDKDGESAKARDAELKAQVDELGSALQQAVTAKAIAEGNLESANRLAEFYKGMLDKAQSAPQPSEPEPAKQEPKKTKSRK